MLEKLLVKIKVHIIMFYAYEKMDGDSRALYETNIFKDEDFSKSSLFNRI